MLKTWAACGLAGGLHVHGNKEILKRVLECITKDAELDLNEEEFSYGIHDTPHPRPTGVPPTHKVDDSCYRHQTLACSGSFCW